MKIGRVYLGDFGIFRNQSLEGIDGGLVVIAGRNRAGKTTFMKALRYLGYGVPRSGTLPPPAGQYEVRAEVEHLGQRYTIHLSGYALPRVYPEGQLSAGDLFNRLDPFTYHQLFTISLDELRWLPDGLPRGGDQEKKLAEVLIGAGLSEVLRVQKIQEVFVKEATAIGGAYGKPDTRQFKEYYRQIEDALKLKEAANLQLEAYYAKSGEQKKLLTEIVPECEADLAAMEEKLQRLELLKDHYIAYQEFSLLKENLEQPENQLLLKSYPRGGEKEAERLKGQVEEAVTEFKKASERFVDTCGGAVEEDLPEKFLACATDIEEYNNKASGWQVEVENLLEDCERIRMELAGLKDDIGELYAPWAGDVSVLRAVKTAHIPEQELKAKVQAYGELRTDYRQKSQELGEWKGILKEKEAQRDTLGPVSGGPTKATGWMLAAAAALAVFLSLIFPAMVAAAVGFAGAVGVLVHYLWQSTAISQQRQRCNEIVSGIADLNSKQRTREKLLKDMEAELDSFSNELNQFKKDFNIPAQVTGEFLPFFIQRTRELQRRYNQYETEELDLRRKNQQLKDQLSLVAAKLHPLGLTRERYQDPIGDSAEILGGVARAAQHLNLATRMKSARTNLEQLRGEALAILKKENPLQRDDDLQNHQELIMALEALMDRGVKCNQLVEKELRLRELRHILVHALDRERVYPLLTVNSPVGLENQDRLLSFFGRLCRGFHSLGEIQSQYEEVSGRVQELKEQLRQWRDKERDLRKDIEDLSSDQKLLQARMQIDQARSGLEPLAEEYATLKIAALLLGRVRKKLLEDTGTMLFAQANRILKSITMGDYDKIQLPGDAGAVAFTACLSGGESQELGDLSRATREQLFLAVRLSRIREIKPDLPVILDDTFANFDPRHTREASRFISELARTHQVFVLTCHPELIECLRGSSCPAQYWGLEKGRFLGPYADGQELIGLLQ